MQLILVSFCPDAPRLLIAKGQESRARTILTTYHANSRPNYAVVEQEIREIPWTFRPSFKRLIKTEMFFIASCHKAATAP